MDRQLPEKPTLSDLQADIAALVKERGWDKNSVTEEFLLFVEEVGELAKEIRKTERLHLDVKKNQSLDLEGELADILNYLLNLSNMLGVDLETAYRKKMEITKSRVWK